LCGRFVGGPKSLLPNILQVALLAACPIKDRSMFPAKSAICLVAGAALVVVTSIVVAPAAGLSTSGTAPETTGSIAVQATGVSGAESHVETRAVRSRSRSPSEMNPGRTGATLVAASSDPSCSRARRKLWVEGEGWIVRRVAVCR